MGRRGRTDGVNRSTAGDCGAGPHHVEPQFGRPYDLGPSVRALRCSASRGGPQPRAGGNLRRVEELTRQRDHAVDRSASIRSSVSPPRPTGSLHPPVGDHESSNPRLTDAFGTRSRPTTTPSRNPTRHLRAAPSHEGVRGASNRGHREIPATGMFHQVPASRRVDLCRLALLEVRQGLHRLHRWKAVTVQRRGGAESVFERYAGAQDCREVENSPSRRRAAGAP